MKTGDCEEDFTNEKKCDKLFVAADGVRRGEKLPEEDAGGSAGERYRRKRRRKMPEEAPEKGAGEKMSEEDAGVNIVRLPKIA